MSLFLTNSGASLVLATGGIPVATVGTPPEGPSKYVRAGATGTGSGDDWTNAYTALPASLTRGTTYWVADGDYSGYTFDDAASGTTLITVRKATTTSHNIDTGWQSAYGDGQAVFTGTMRWDTDYYVFDGITGGGPGAWTSGHGFKIVQTSAAPVLTSGTNSVTGGSHLQVRHVELVGGNRSNPGGGSWGNDAVAVYGGSDITLSYAYSHAVSRCHFFLSGTGLLCEYSYLGTHGNDAEVHNEVASIWNFVTSVSNVTFRHNLFAHVESTGGLIMEGDGLYVYGNVFHRPSGDTWVHGNGLIGTWSSSTLTNCKVYHNTFIDVNTGGWPVLGTTYSGTPTGNDASNNLFYSCSAVGGAGTLFPTHSYNHYVDTTSPTEATKTTASGDPFTDYAALDYRLEANTTSGQTLGATYATDMTGASRATWTRGALEYAGEGGGGGGASWTTVYGPDAFGSANDTPLPTHNAVWSNDYWYWTCSGGRATSTGFMSRVSNTTTLANDQAAEAKIYNNDNYNGVICRYTSTGAGQDEFQGYGLYYNGNAVYLYKRVAGVWTELDSAALTFVAGCTIRVQAVGTAITGYVNGVEYVSATDAALTSGVTALRGITGAQLDDFKAEEYA